MKQITYAGKSLLVDDEAGAYLFEYARLLVRDGGSDVVSLRGISSEGNEAELTFLLGGSASIVAATADASIPLPSNAASVATMRARIELIEHPPAISPQWHPRPQLDWDI